MNTDIIVIASFLKILCLAFWVMYRCLVPLEISDVQPVQSIGRAVIGAGAVLAAFEHFHRRNLPKGPFTAQLAPGDLPARVGLPFKNRQLLNLTMIAAPPGSSNENGPIYLG
ncbi:MAG TPA: hypothetical protein VGK74_08910 [Symbiobacteriaceae bacterium]|jgi:hypothetical protein